MESPLALNTVANFELIFQALHSPSIVFSPELHILAVSDSYLRAVRRTREEIIGRYVFDVFTDNPNSLQLKAIQNAKEAYLRVIEHKKPLQGPLLRYDIRNSGETVNSVEEKYWESTLTPILDSTGSLLYILQELRDYTPELITEREAEKSVDHFRALTEGIGGVVWECNIPKNQLIWSPSYKNNFGYSDQELLTSLEEWDKNVHPEDYERIIADLELVKQTKGRTWTGKYRFLRADGTYAEVLDHGYIFYDEAGNIERMLGSMVDLGQQKQREQELRESNQRFERIAMATNDVIWDWSLHNDKLWWNEGIYTLFGYENKSTTSIEFWTERIHPEDAASVKDSINSFINSNETFWEQEYRFKCADGSYKIIHDQGYVIRDASDKPTRMVGAMLDITEKKKIEQERESQLNWMRKLLDSLPHMTWTATPEGITEYFNEQWIRYTGLTQAESLGFDSWLSAIHPEDQQRTIERWMESVNSGINYEIEYRIRNGKQGPFRWFLGKGVALRDAQGRIEKWVGSCIDIEDHKRAEEGLIEKNLELEHINQDLDGFVYTASHDLKLPIINMAGIFEELIQSAEFSDPEAPKMIGLFNKSLQQIHNTIHELSEVVKVQKTKRRDLEEVPIRAVVQDVALSLQNMITETYAQITTDFAEAPYVYFTKGSLKSVLYNLISNSIKYRAQDRTPQIKISTKIKDNFVELRISDNGLGLDMNKHQSKLFQMFKRFHNHVNGSGLGLYIVNRLLTNHGGYINVESSLGKGTTFLLYFKHNKIKN
ncbi:PAS domain-containing sensor histidine kinase [Pontibacter sp. MBLB2868]|uniref:PAS domain-containing sensor histidine kinase n=1 Tax=Pontibacter sp. MBLB2868 TaxID=3451555 RepID=UPI003F74BEAE